MKVIFMRHGQAESYKHPDSSRQLTDYGRIQAQETAKYIMANYQPDCFVVSPYDRAKQTLAVYNEIAPNIPTHVLDSITPQSDAKQALDKLYDIASTKQLTCVLVVCHMPVVSYMVSLLTGTAATSYALAEARVIECSDIVELLGSQIDQFIPQQPH